MWSSDRRTFLAGLGAFSLSACGFTPVYGPEGAGSRLLNAVALPAPTSDNAYDFNRRFEERLGVAAEGAPYRLGLQLQTTIQDIGATSGGSILRQRVVGRAFYSLVDASTSETLLDRRTNAFTGYSTTGSTVATRAAQRDANKRLMIILADQIIDELILSAPTFPK